MGVATVDHGSMEPISEVEYLALPEDGLRRELVDGYVLVSPAPSFPHQRVANRLWSVLDSAAPAGFEVLTTVNIRLGSGRILIPDVAVMTCAGISEDVGAASDLGLVAEIVSPSSGQHDRVRKPGLYAQAGIPALVLVDPDAPRVTVLRLTPGGTYETVAEAEGDEKITLVEPFEVTIVPSSLLAVRPGDRSVAEA